MTPILPGATIGILGGGQLGRMMAMAARSLGYHVRVMDPDPSCPARFVVDSCLKGGWNDASVAADLARGCDVVTLEIEQVSTQCLTAAEQHAPVRPNPATMTLVQNRIQQKVWLAQAGFPVGPFLPVRSLDDLQRVAIALGPNLFLKSARGGYDGRSQVRIMAGFPAELESAWESLGKQPCVAEQAIALRKEVSVMVARRPSGEVRIFPVAHNHHEKQILVWSALPASLSPELERTARQIAMELAEKLHLEGVLAVEMFHTEDDRLLINELAPRPHNSYHTSERACSTSQFEQAIRAVCDLPLGDTDVVRPAAIVNLLGDLWLAGHPRFDRALAIPGVNLHLYEKQQPRAGRKMGHLSAIADTPEQAVERVLLAKKQLTTVEG